MQHLLRLFVFFTLVLSSCVTREVHQGHEIPQSAVAKLRINKSTKEEVIDILGNPSFSSTFSNDIWYYVSIKRTGVSAFSQGTTYYKMLQLTFKNGVLQKKLIDSGSKEKVMFNANKTPIYGDNLSGFKDFMNNLGKFNKKSGNKKDN